MKEKIVGVFFVLSIFAVAISIANIIDHYLGKPPIFELLEANRSLYRVHLSLDTGEVYNTWCQKLEITDSSVIIYRIRITDEPDFAFGNKPVLWGVEFDNSTIDSFSYRDISDSLKYYQKR